MSKPKDLRSQFIKYAPVPREQHEIQLDPKDPESKITVEVRGLSATARGRLLNEVMIDSEDGDDRKIDLAKLHPMLVCECTFDPQSGERVFSNADFDTVGSFNAAVLDPIATIASRLSGLGDKAMKEAEKSVPA